jgi:hypothetical protein
MKTLKNILSGIMLVMIIPFGFSQQPVINKQVITLKGDPGKATVKLLQETKEVLSRRLTYLGLTDVQITQRGEKPELVVTVGDTIPREALLELLLTRGHAAFYETMDGKEFLEKAGKHHSGCMKDSFKSLHFMDTLLPGAGPVVGFADGRDSIAFNACLTSAAGRAFLPGHSGLLWSVYPAVENSFSLYAISYTGRAFSERDIQEVHGDYENPEHPALCITFKENAWKAWNDATLRNMNKAMAFTLDNKVYSAPRILDAIPSGKISMTGGGYTKTGVRMLVAILSAGVVPIELSVVSND